MIKSAPYRFLNLPTIANVGQNRQRLNTELFTLSGDVIEGFAPFACDQDHVRTFSGKRKSNRLADVPAGAGYQSGLALESHRSIFQSLSAFFAGHDKGFSWQKRATYGPTIARNKRPKGIVLLDQF
jgi:hypothetical protein